jgi:hypothetical protein
MLFSKHNKSNDPTRFVYIAGIDLSLYREMILELFTKFGEFDMEIGPIQTSDKNVNTLHY